MYVYVKGDGCFPTLHRMLLWISSANASMQTGGKRLTAEFAGLELQAERLAG